MTQHTRLNTLEFRKDEKFMKDLKLDVKNERSAMLEILGYFVQGLVSESSALQNLLGPFG